ncbi:MAG: hypothetical protein PVG66_08815 [Chromatiales bacterium]
MQVPFSEHPGRHERHFRRKLDNPLFPRPIHDYSNDDLLEVQRVDHEEIVAFLARLRQLVQQAVELQPNVESQVVLDLKAELEKLYETACRIGDQQGNNKAAISELLKIIMATVRAHSGGDSKAEMELNQEELARREHFALLENSLVVDLIDPDSPIQSDELASVLLGATEDELQVALPLFDQDQRFLLAEQAEKILADNHRAQEPAMQNRLKLIRPD